MSASATVDRFGSRVTSKAAKINASFGKSPVTHEELRAKHKKVPAARIYNHIRYLKAKGLIRETKDGFVIRSKGR